MKYEVASEVGVNLKQGYNGDLSAKENGTVGGYMVKRMFDEYYAKLTAPTTNGPQTHKFV